MSRPATPAGSFLLPQNPSPMDPSAGRLMQVKVLYTFDDAKTNCLARCPSPIPVRTAMLDPSTEVGIIELRTCVEAIANASPELVAKLGQDFTIYAYDYSEYETPLVGQGMLSWALAAASATPTAPAQQSQTPVTGRVTRGGLNLFNPDGAAETLEVKLKLVPVPTSLQSDYLQSMQKYRDASNFNTQGGDAAAWHNFIQANPSLTMPSPNFGFQRGVTAGTNLPNAAQSQSAGHSNVASHEQTLAIQDSHFQPVNAPVSQPASRPATPKGWRSGQQSKPSSRASSTRGRPKLKQTSSASQVEGVTSEDNGDFASEQPRKRARVEQAIWRGPSALNTASDSLRVAASTAASIRGHGTSAANPAAAQIIANEAPVRPPTPRPAAPRTLKRTNTSLAHDAIMHRPRQSSGLTGMGGSLTDNEGSIASSPPESRYDSAGSTPMDIPSSPPLIGHAPYEPSSPVLPRAADFVDSGFGSGTFDDLFDDKIDEVSAAVGEDGGQAVPSPRRRASQPKFDLTSELSITEEVPGDPTLLPQKTLLTKVPPQPGARKAGAKRRAASEAASSPYLGPQPSHSAEGATVLCLEAVTFDEDYAPAKSLQEEFIAPQIPGLPTIAPRPGSERRDSFVSLPPAIAEAKESVEPAADLGPGMRRRQAIRGRLEADLAAGKLPPFCKNCGEIETPTWRKCFVRNMQGAPPVFAPRAGEESYLGNEIVETNEDGEPTAYRVIRRSIARGEMGWQELRLCNSCGMWLFKMKSMRPPEKWGKGSKGKFQSKKKPARSKSANTTGEPQSDAGSPADNEAETPNESGFPPTEIEPFRAGGANSDYDAKNGTGPRERSADPELQRRKSGGDLRSLNDASAVAALERAIKSSPPKFPGSQATPIDLEGANKSPSVNRLLFPSPRKAGEMKTLDGSGVGQSGNVTIPVSSAIELTGITEHDKENTELPRLRSGNTPNKATVKMDDIFKTPTRRAISATGLTPDQFSPGGIKLRRSPRFSPSKSKSPNKNPITPFTASFNQMLSDPPQSPTSFSDQFNLFSGMAFGEANNALNFNDFATNDGYATDMPLPPSDADYFPVLNDFDMGGEAWDGGPLFDGELDALLQEANDNGCEKYFAATGIAEDQVEGSGANAGADAMTPSQQ